MTDARERAQPTHPVAVAPARSTAMSWDTVLHGMDAVQQSDAGRRAKAVRIAELIRKAGGYCWVGLYEVTDREIAVLGWCLPASPLRPSVTAAGTQAVADHLALQEKEA